MLISRKTGAAETIFVKDKADGLVCTLYPDFDWLSSVCSETETALQALLDNAIADYICKLCENHNTVSSVDYSSGQNQSNESCKSKSSSQSPKPAGTSDDFTAGDLVRLRVWVKTSSKGGVTRLIQGKKIFNSNQAASAACLGADTDGRIGVVIPLRADCVGAYGGSNNLDRSIVTVASIHSGHVCEYSNRDLMYADGTLPGWTTVNRVDVNCISTLPAPGRQQTYFARRMWQERIERVKQQSKNAPFIAGDRVKLKHGAQCEGWSLRDGEVGVVIGTPHQAGAAEQRFVLVSSLNDANKFSFFRGSWLELAEKDNSIRFNIGDFVQLDPCVRAPEQWRKCLGHPADLQYGMVIGSGIVRDGIQRNVEVAVVDSENSGNDDEFHSSFYPSFALITASPFSVFTKFDRHSLIDAARSVVARIGIRLDCDDMVEKLGPDTWSELWKMCLKFRGSQTFAQAFRRWQSKRDLMTSKLKQFLRNALLRINNDANQVEGLPAQHNVSFQLQTKLNYQDWTCKICEFTGNPANTTICQLCGKRGAPWTCEECKTENNVGASDCIACRRNGECHPDRRNLPVAGDGSKLDILYPLMISNLDHHISEKSLLELFSNHGKVISVHIEVDQSIAFINFSNSRDANYAYTRIHREQLGSEGRMVRGNVVGATLFKDHRPLKRYSCQSCSFSNLIEELRCCACQAIRPVWIERALSEMDRKNWKVGGRVVLHPDYASFGDASSGPLVLGDWGTIACFFSQDQTVTVDKDGKQWRYDKNALILAEEEDSDGVPVVKMQADWKRWSSSAKFHMELTGEPDDNSFTSECEIRMQSSQVLDDACETIENYFLSQWACIFASTNEVDSMLNELNFDPFFLEMPRYAPITCLRGLTTSTDSDGNTSAHHAALMGLQRTLKALYQLGASPFVPNNLRLTAALVQDGYHDIKPARPDLHRACKVGAFFNLESMVHSFSPTIVVRMALKTPSNYSTPQSLVPVKQALLESGGSGKALMLAQRLLFSDVHSRAYMAVAMLNENFGVKAARLELERYLMSLHISTDIQGTIVDPIFYYAHYLMWTLEGRPRQKNKILLAACAIIALKCFPKFAAEWTTQEEDIDANSILQSDRGENGDENASDDDSDDQESEPHDPYEPASEWKLAKEYHAMNSRSMDELMALTGLASVKRTAIGVVKHIILQKTRPPGINAETSLNFLFVGNPGSGKTTVARLLARAMAELGLRKTASIQETSAQAILKITPNPVAGFEKLVKSAVGGTLFIDEAYRFAPNKGPGPPNVSNGILDYLLEAVEDKAIRESTTFILAGYKDDMDTLLSYNIGFASRFSREFHFPDYTEHQLKQILVSMVKSRGLQLEPRRNCNSSIAAVLAQRIARGSGKKGFGNARAVRNKVEEIINNQTQRLGTLELYNKPVSPKDYKILALVDTIGLRPDYSRSPIMRELESLVGLSKVKCSFQKLIDLQVQNYDRELSGDKPECISLHRVFYGNPGTGKTTVARLYGAVLKDLGLLSKGDFLECTPADLTGDAEGGAAANTKSMLERARGKVLFIDEAYVLDPRRKGNQYGGNVLDTLVEKIEGEAGSDIAVILAGYKQEMFDMLENNPGLRRRFNLDDFGIHFEDMSDADLRKVLIRMVGKAGLAVENMEVVDNVVRMVSQKRFLSNFGNAGAVESLLNIAKVNKAIRLANASRQQGKEMQQEFQQPSPLNPDVLILSDFLTEELALEAGKNAFGGLHNLEYIADIVLELESVISAAKLDGKDPAHILADCHMVFVGPPGTGKTTVAMKFGVLFKNLGLLPTDNVVAVTGTSLQGQYVGETKNKVVKAMQQARGGILFIDEAYGLDPGNVYRGYASEAVDTLIGEITSDEFKGNLLVIMAGYADKMENLFARANPGLRSRFDKRRVEFKPWTGQQAVAAAMSEIGREGKCITKQGEEELHRSFAAMASLPGWASARDVYETVLPSMYSKRAVRMMLFSRFATESNVHKRKSHSIGRKQASPGLSDIPYDVADVEAAFVQQLQQRSQAAANTDSY